MTNEEISKAVREFEKVIRPDFGEIMSKKLEDAQVDIYVEALYQGYRDACRTFEWEKKDDTERKESIKELFKVSVAKEIQEFLQGEKEFEPKHKDMCKKLKIDLKSKGVKNMTYGKSQKIINMAFKYLYCCEHDKKMDEQFDKCHMPLDSFSLEWFKRKFKEEDFTSLEKEEYEKLFKKTNGRLGLKYGAVGSWSSMESEDDDVEGSYEYYPYEFYLKKIEEYCDKNNITPLKLDFVVWPKIQKIMAADAFIKVFSDGNAEEKENLEKKENPEAYDIDKLEETWKNRIKKIQEMTNKESDINENC